MNISDQLSQKSIHAAVSAIEVYNKPDFHFREEAFSLLMTNAWELILKAKWLKDNDDDIEAIYERKKDGSTKNNRCGNPITYGATHIAIRFLEDKDINFTKPVFDNLIALIEIRDNSAHFLNKDLYFGRRVLEVGTASLQNFLRLITEWFDADLSHYNFFLMPLSFYHGFEAATPSSVTAYPEQVNNLLSFIDKLCEEDRDEESEGHSMAVRLETRFVRAKDADSVSFRWTDDPNAPAVTMREEDVLKNYPLTYDALRKTLKRRYSDFLENMEYHRIRKEIQKEKKYCIVRYLDPGNPKSTKKRLYNPNMIREFDKHYTKRKGQQDV